MYHPQYFVGMTDVAGVKEVFNTDDTRYGGSGKLNHHVEVDGYGIHISLAPLSTMIFSIEYK